MGRRYHTLDDPIGLPDRQKVGEPQKLEGWLLKSFGISGDSSRLMARPNEYINVSAQALRVIFS